VAPTFSAIARLGIFAAKFLTIDLVVLFVLASVLFQGEIQSDLLHLGLPLIIVYNVRSLEVLRAQDGLGHGALSPHQYRTLAQPKARLLF